MFLFAALMLTQTVPQQCTAMDAALPAPLAGWTAPGAAFGINRAVVLDASAAGTIPQIPAGGKPGGVAMIGFRIEKPGIYGVALDQPGWIDVTPVAPQGETLKSVRHGHGPDCSTIRKIVRFDLQPGLYRVTLTGLTKAQARAMLVEGE